MSKSKYSLTFKEEVINYYHSGKDGYTNTARHFGLDRNQVRTWVTIHKHGGLQALQPKERSKRYSANFKHCVVSAMQKDNLSSMQAAIKFKIMDPPLVRAWLRFYKRNGVIALHPNNHDPYPKMKKVNKNTTQAKKSDKEKTQKELLDELLYLRAENAYLKKLQALIQEKQTQGKGPKSSLD